MVRLVAIEEVDERRIENFNVVECSPQTRHDIPLLRRLHHHHFAEGKRANAMVSSFEEFLLFFCSINGDYVPSQFCSGRRKCNVESLTEIRKTVPVYTRLHIRTKERQFNGRQFPSCFQVENCQSRSHLQCSRSHFSKARSSGVIDSFTLSSLKRGNILNWS